MFSGTKRTQYRDTAEVAKLIRADIKAAIKSGSLPRGNYSVTISRFSGGSSLRVRISDLPFVVINRDKVAADIAEPSVFNGLPAYSAVGQEILSRVESLVSSYNRDNSDTQTDYFDVDFYQHVMFAYDWERAQFEAIASQIRERAA